MVEYLNAVVCVHPNDSGRYVFRAPDTAERKLNVGDRVLVDTKRGPGQMAQCITPQFRIADFQLKEYYGVEVKNLRPVTAYLHPVVFANVMAEE